MSEQEHSRGTIHFIAVITLLLAGCSGSGGGSEPAPPAPAAYNYSAPVENADGWRTASADTTNVDIDTLETMMNAVQGGQFSYVDSIAVARSGSLILDETIRVDVDAEDGRVGNTDPRMHAQFSATKSITALAVGVAIDAGYLGGVDTPYLDFFDYPSYANWDERKAQITLGDVLAMRSGLQWNEWNPDYSSPDNRLTRFYAEEVDYAKAVLDLPMAADPGEGFVYNTAATISLAQAIENRAPLAFVDFGSSSLLAPLNISDVEFLTTPTGLPNVGGGFYFITRDMAKFGQLMLDDGRWNGQVVVSAAWISEITTMRTTITWPNPADWDWQMDGYGYHWWLGHYDVDGARFDSWVMWGFGGQWVIVVPQLQLVVAVNSHGYDNSDAALNQAHKLVRDFIIPATN